MPTIIVGDVEVPDVDDAGTTEAEATAAIGLQFLAYSVTYEYSEIVPSGEVISQDPPGGTEVEPGSTVTLVISRGMEPEAGNGIGFIEPIEFIGFIQ